MKNLSSEDRKRIEESLRQKYFQVAFSPEGNFQYPTGKAGLREQSYSPDILKSLPDDVLSSYCGVGNPFSLGPINGGEAVLDVGCGAGVDSLIAAAMVGPHGKVVGVDLIPEMLERAKKNLQLTAFSNVSFEKATAEHLPFPDASFDVVISNGVLNLVPDKLKALKEVHRVLKPCGRLMMADQILTVVPPKDPESMVANWARWQGGAIPGKDFLAILNEAGFLGGELVKDTGFNSSSVTKGVLFRARKLEKAQKRFTEMKSNPMERYDEFFSMVYQAGALDVKTKHLIALGASLGAGCQPWTDYCLAVARQNGATETEIKEAVMLAMTVGAHKIKLMAEKGSANITEPAALESITQAAECKTWTPS